MDKARRWTFTLNNWTEDELRKCFTNPDCKYMIYGFEVGTEGTPHLQGYVEWANAIGFKRVKRCLSERSHIEKAIYPAEYNIKYCSKDGNWIEFGERPLGQGCRSDLHAVAGLIKEGKPLSVIRDAHPVEYIRYGRGIRELALGIPPPKWRDVDVEVYWGPTGTGKTRKAMEGESVFKLNTNSNGTLWFDGYDGESTLVLDDFYGWIKWGELLTILDGYPYRCQVKGGTLWARWTRVVITSNKQPSEWYEGRDQTPLNRRIRKIEPFLTQK
nr:MAG: replication associated protein [Arizlama virus]